MADFIPVAMLDDLKENRATVVEAGGVRIALCRTKEGVFAIDDLCTHDDGPLGAGSVVDCIIECPRHGARFDVRTGAVVRMPAVAPVRSYPVKVENGKVSVKIED